MSTLTYAYHMTLLKTKGNSHTTAGKVCSDLISIHDDVKLKLIFFLLLTTLCDFTDKKSLFFHVIFGNFTITIDVLQQHACKSSCG